MRDRDPSPGDERTVTWFAWLPVYVGQEQRWLERVTVRQMWDAWYGWVNVGFQ